MIEDDDLKRTIGAVMHDGNLWAFLPDGSIVQAAGDGADPRYRNLRNASLVMYHTLSNAEGWIEKLITWLEAAGAEDAVDGTLKMQAAISVTRRIAREGLETLAVDKKDD
jgi:hypothetical protein